MAAVTQVTKGTVGWCEPYKSMWVCEGTGFHYSNALESRQNLKRLTYHITVATDGDTYTLGVQGLKFVFWTGADGLAANVANPYISDVATGEVTMVTGGGTPAGYLTLFYGG
jgi:hypothetical protein